MSRPTWDEYFMEITELVSRRSTCLRRKVGAVIVQDKRILTTGYNGAPQNTPHCTDIGCLRDKLKVKSGERHELCRGIHAEQNAIINAARAGVSLLGGDMYIFGSTVEEPKTIDAIPCFICKKMIINAGLNRVVSSGKDENMMIFHTDEWINDWKENDIIDDKKQYG